MLRLGLQDIISQEEAQKELIKEYASKRSLQEIQEEQEFLRWWESESKRIQAEEEEAVAAVERLTTTKQIRSQSKRDSKPCFERSKTAPRSSNGRDQINGSGSGAGTARNKHKGTSKGKGNTAT
jgi:hypothetical protein